MNQSTHIDMSLTVLEALGWTGDAKLVAKNAAFPDQVRLIEVTGLGFNFMGHGFQSLEHFGMPGPKDAEGRFVLNGYCFKRDKSVPHLDLPNRTTIVHPEAWGDAVQKADTEKAEPTYTITHVPGYKTYADEMTFAAASAMADWTEKTYRKLRVAKEAALCDTTAGWAFHFVQDLCVPHHVLLLLLDGHSGFEGDVDECWNRMKGAGTVNELLKTLVKADNASEPTIRAIAEHTAPKSVVSLRKLRLYHCLWRKGWNKLVHQCVLRGLTASVKVGKVLMREAGQNV